MWDWKWPTLHHFENFHTKNWKEQRAPHGTNNFSIPCHLCSSDVEWFCKLQCVFYKLDPNLGFGTLALELTMHCAYQSRFVYHLKRRRWPRKLVKYIIVWKCLFLSKATENETNREVWIRRGRGDRCWRCQGGSLVASCPLSSPGPCCCTAVTAASPRSWWQGSWSRSSCRWGRWRLKQKLDGWGAPIGRDG